ncbi:glycosyltransferase family 2 protein [Luteimonas sp. A537]
MRQTLGRGAIELLLEPMHHLEALPASGAARAWSAVGVDPQFLVSHRGGERFRAGWYLLELDIEVADGYFDNPCFYPDYGAGAGDGSRINFAPTVQGGKPLRAVVRLDHDVVSLRFDPSTAPCSFTIHRAALVPMGTFTAAARMCARLWARLSRDRSLWSFAAREAFDSFRQGGVGGFGDWLYLMHEERARGGVVSLDYAAWIERFDRLSDADLNMVRQRCERLARRPLVSVLVPVYNTPEDYLRRCIESVRAQVYPHWELCLVDDASPDPRVAEVLAGYASLDPRIRVIRRERNGHISEASNTALEAARGEYVALLDHDDEITAHALYLVVKAINEQPGLKLLYSDEDKLDANGTRFDPYFKPDWNPELLRSQNYLCHLGVYDASLVRAVGGFRRGFEGSQDHDLALRCAARLSPGEIGHVPHVLYHWRAIEGSTALSGSAKDYTEDAGRRAIEDHLEDTGDHGARVEAVTGGYRVHYAVPSPAPRVSLVVPTRDRVDLLRTCIDSITRLTRYPDYNLLVVDNQSSDPETLEYLRAIDGNGLVRVLRDESPFNYSRINNAAVRASDGAIVGLVNNDIEAIHAGWLEEMVGHAVRPRTGAVGAMLYYPDDRIQHAGVVIGLGGVAGHAYVGLPRGYPGQQNRGLLAQNLTAVTAACLLVRREVFDEVGGLDESLEVAFNDVDFCLRVAERGYYNVWTPWAELYHHESASRGYEDNPEKKARFSREVNAMVTRWGKALRWDPAYNPNLGLEGHDFPLAIPPRLPLKQALRGSVAACVRPDPALRRGVDMSSIRQAGG